MAKSRSRAVTRYVTRYRSRNPGRKRSWGAWKKKKVSLAIIGSLMPPIASAQVAFNANPTRPLFERMRIAFYQWFSCYTGYNINMGGWFTPALRQGLVPLALAMGLHYGANRFGVNRLLKRVPLIEI